jgi:hypothetical protein
LADLDGDGRRDLLSGDFFGQVHWFARLPDGSFAAAELLRTADGALLDAVDASTPLPCDVDGDGQLDLLIGNMDGELLWARGILAAPQVPASDPSPPIEPDGARTSGPENADARRASRPADLVSDLGVEQGAVQGAEPGAEQRADRVTDQPGEPSPAAALGLPPFPAPRFEPPRPFLVQGQPVRRESGDAAPVLGDWDRDGDLDLLLGAQDGSLVWYPNLSGPGLTALGPEELLIEPLPWGQRGQGRSDKRIKPALFDWNGDGWLDLALGDYTVLDGPPSDPAALAPAQAELAAAEAALEPWQTAQSRRAEALLATWRGAQTPPPTGDDPRLYAEAHRQAMAEAEQDPAYRQAMVAQLAALARYALLDTRFDERGHLWIHLRQPPPAR